MFSGGSITPFANGGVVSGPTMFPMKGGKTGLMGEAGEEAVVPLRRGADGRLGIDASGVGSSSGKVNVQVINQSGTQMNATSEESRGPDGGRNIRIMLEPVVMDIMTRGGGRTLLEKGYGLRRNGR